MKTLKELTSKGLKQALRGESDAPDRNTPDTKHPRMVNAYGQESSGPNPHVGDDLTERDLDDLYDAVIRGVRRDSLMAEWWWDKPHQLLNRLLLRLTRAEHPELEEIPK